MSMKEDVHKRMKVKEVMDGLHESNEARERKRKVMGREGSIQVKETKKKV